MAAAVAAVPVALLAVLLLLVTRAEGAYAVRAWGPLAVLALVLVAAAGIRRPVRGPVLVAVLGLWGFALWAGLSALWADSPGRALEGAGRHLLYAALLTVPVATIPDRRTVRWLTAGLVAGIALIVVVTFAELLFDGSELFLAGRLDAPINYRNGTAALFALAAWPLICLAAARRSPALIRAIGFAIAILAMGLAFMTQSRGVLIGFLAGGAVAVALGPDPVRRTWLGLLAVAAVAVVADDLLAPYDAFVDKQPVTDALIADGARALGVVSLASFVVVGALALLDGGLRLSPRALRTGRIVAVGTLVGLTIAMVVGGLVAVGDPVGRLQDKAREFRSLDASAPGETRLGSTGGQRYDLWRIAMAEFRSAPAGGVGEGNYPSGYYVERTTNRNLSTPHSLPIGILAEEGLVGALLFLMFLGGAATALVLASRRLSVETRRWVSGLAAMAAVVIAQSTVDWLWLIPGLAGLASLCLGLALAMASAPEGDVAELPRRRWWQAAPALVPALGAVLAAALFLSDYEVRKARAAGLTSPAAQLAAARTAEDVNPFAMTPLYLQAGALEDLGRPQPARSALLRALDREPRNFVTLALLGDYETRRGNREAARGWYRRALRLNPLDIGLQQLAQR